MKKPVYLIVFLVLLVVVIFFVIKWLGIESEEKKVIVNEVATGSIYYFDEDNNTNNKIDEGVMASLSNNERDEEIRGQIEIFQLQWTLFLMTNLLSPEQSSFVDFFFSDAALEQRENLNLLTNNNLYAKADNDNIIVAAKLTNGKWYCADKANTPIEISQEPVSMFCQQFE